MFVIIMTIAFTDFNISSYKSKIGNFSGMPKFYCHCKFAITQAIFVYIMWNSKQGIEPHFLCFIPHSVTEMFIFLIQLNRNRKSAFIQCYAPPFLHTKNTITTMFSLLILYSKFIVMSMVIYDFTEF